MLDCQRINELITPYVDGVLDSVGRDGVDRHVAVCPPCRVRLGAERSARAAVKRVGAGLSAPLPPGLQSRCETLAREHARRGASRLWRRWAPVGIGAAVVAAAAIVLAVATGESNRVLAAQLAADHAKCFSIFPPRDRTGMTRDEAERELAANGWPMRVPGPLPSIGLKLLGIRACLTAAGSIPHVLYEVNGTPVSLFKLDGERRTETIDILGRQCRIWQRSDATFVLVADDRGRQDVARIAGYIEQEAR